MGEFTTGENGELNANVTVPSTVAAGFHTLHVYGKSFSGEPIDYYQIIEVRGQEGDIDEDGTADNADACLYIVASGVDSDKDGTDDACDAEISAKPLLYRVRNGIVAKGEQPSYMYIERNTRASSVTGVSGDYDPDNDGWAIVAASKGVSDSGIPVNFWVDDNKKPHVSIRTAQNGCVQYTANSVAKVIPTLTRSLKKEASNTGNCRYEPPADDVDSDGTPDDEQQLYRVRNGDVDKGEDAEKIYIERSRVAAEAQLHLADYAPSLANGQLQSWNLLASSQNKATKGVFKKLVMVGNEPVILIQTPMNTCVAVKPGHLKVIKQSNQTGRGLAKIPLPEGANCAT